MHTQFHIIKKCSSRLFGQQSSFPWFAYGHMWIQNMQNACDDDDDDANVSRAILWGLAGRRICRCVSLCCVCVFFPKTCTAIITWYAQTHIFPHFPSKLNTFPCYASKNHSICECWWTCIVLCVEACPCGACVYAAGLVFMAADAGECCWTHSRPTWCIHCGNCKCARALSVRIHESIKHAANTDTRLFRVRFGNTQTTSTECDRWTKTHKYTHMYVHSNS